MNSVDLQNGVFEEEGLKMLQNYEEKSKLLLLGGKNDNMKLNSPAPERQTSNSDSGSFEDFLKA